MWVERRGCRQERGAVASPESVGLNKEAVSCNLALLSLWQGGRMCGGEDSLQRLGMIAFLVWCGV